VDILVDAGWLAAHRDDVVVADVRFYLDGRSTVDAYAAAHLPGAVYVDLGRDLSSPGDPTDGRHPLPSPEDFAAAMRRLGIGDDDTVVAYDDSGGGTAGRLVWMLRATGHDAALLDGGLRAWPGAIESGPPPTAPLPTAPAATAPPATAPAATFTARPWPAASLASADEVAALAASSSAAVLDARAGDRYRGETEPVDPRAGHIPGAASAPWQDNLDPATGRFLPPDVLRARFEALGVRPDQPVVAYCGSGVSACANLVALERAGLAGARLYVASWSGWSADPERPAASGDDTAPE
jgi:thiosulfate/3-mercaptopyruvate sulfurtransferase